MHKLAKVQKLMGAPLAPLESFLLARGLRSLHVRMQRHGENAMEVAKMLDAHPMIDRTFYPGLPSHPEHTLAKTVIHGGRFHLGRCGTFPSCGLGHVSGLHVGRRPHAGEAGADFRRDVRLHRQGR